MWKYFDRNHSKYHLKKNDILDKTLNYGILKPWKKLPQTNRRRRRKLHIGGGGGVSARCHKLFILNTSHISCTPVTTSLVYETARPLVTSDAMNIRLLLPCATMILVSACVFSFFCARIFLLCVYNRVQRCWFVVYALRAFFLQCCACSKLCAYTFFRAYCFRVCGCILEFVCVFYYCVCICPYGLP